MRRLYSFMVILVVIGIDRGYSQSTYSKNVFTLNGQIIGKDTGTVILWYAGLDNQIVADTLKLIKGKFSVSGAINRACESLLWTDLKKRNFDDPSVIQFLLEPVKVDISFISGDPLNRKIKGSNVQAEKENWDKLKLLQLTQKEQYYRSRDSSYRLFKKTSDSTLLHQVSQAEKGIDSTNNIIKTVDVDYIKNHPNSYLSAYLLWQHRRKLPIDSIQLYYGAMTNDVKKSSLGHLVLSYVYPLTNDAVFRQANPLADSSFEQQLKKITSIYDIQLKDISGKSHWLNSFKGKFLVIDFWASWCKPCIENVPALNRLMGDYKYDPIQFISISLDNNTDAWKRAIRKYRFFGMQLTDPVGFKGLIAIYCKVLFVPRYIIADQNGQIINYAAPQALEPELKTLLDNMLRKKTL